MPCERNTEEIGRFMRANNDLLIMASEDVLIQFCEEGGWIKMSLVIGQNATMTAIRDFLPIVKEWRERLTHYQGYDTGSGREWLLETLWQRKHWENLSYKQIAESLNRQIAVMIREYVRFMEELNRAKLEWKTVLDWEEWDSKHDPRGLSLARETMRVMGINEEDTKLYVEDAISNIEQGEAAFLPDSPITRDMVISQLRQWDKKRSKGWEK